MTDKERAQVRQLLQNITSQVGWKSLIDTMKDMVDEIPDSYNTNALSYHLRKASVIAEGVR